jgi:glycosyltransferase involved in cell wall biosynthesis
MPSILIEGWFNLPHSYAIVACFELYYMYKNFHDFVNFYTLEKKYISPIWQKNKIFPKKFYEILDKLIPFEKINNDYSKIDLIYRISFPYNLSINNDNFGIPKCIFYTSEYMNLEAKYFENFKDLDTVKKYLVNFRNQLYFISPSIWSCKGLENIDPFYKINTHFNKCIPHGVDLEIYFRDPENRIKTREKYHIKETDILLMNMGSLSGNKGIQYIIYALCHLVKQGRTDVKLFLKGLKDLYVTKDIVSNFVKLYTDDVDIFINKYIIIIYDTLSFDEMKNLYNACDLYISPYIAEGFNITPLEALACGTKVVIPETGSTKEYIEDIYKNGGSEFIYKTKSKIDNKGLNYYNNIDTEDLLKIISSFKKIKFNQKKYDQMLIYLTYNYSWNKIAMLKFDYFMYVLNRSKPF